MTDTRFFASISRKPRYYLIISEAQGFRTGWIQEPRRHLWDLVSLLLALTSSFLCLSCVLRGPSRMLGSGEPSGEGALSPAPLSLLGAVLPLLMPPCGQARVTPTVGHVNMRSKPAEVDRTGWERHGLSSRESEVWAGSRNRKVDVSLGCVGSGPWWRPPQAQDNASRSSSSLRNKWGGPVFVA